MIATLAAYAWRGGIDENVYAARREESANLSERIRVDAVGDGGDHPLHRRTPLVPSRP